MSNTFVFTAAVVLVSSFANAQAPDEGRRHGPPPEALSACAGLSDGVACAFTHHGDNLTGTCRKGPSSEAAACMPAGGPGGRHRGPPPVALEACKTLTAGAACSVTFGDKTINGTCATGGPANELACRPADTEGHHRGPPPKAFEACKSLAVGAECSVSFGEKTLSGTCRVGPSGEAAACVPARPPER